MHAAILNYINLTQKKVNDADRERAHIDSKNPANEGELQCTMTITRRAGLGEGGYQTRHGMAEREDPPAWAERPGRGILGMKNAL